MDPQSPAARGGDNTTTPKPTHKLIPQRQSTTNTSTHNADFETKLESEPSAVAITSATDSEKDNPKVTRLLKWRPTFSSAYGQKKYLWRAMNEKDGEPSLILGDGNSSSLNNEDYATSSTARKARLTETLQSDNSNVTSDDERKFSEKVSRDKKLRKKRKTQQEELRKIYKITPRSDGEEADDEREK